MVRVPLSDDEARRVCLEATRDGTPEYATEQTWKTLQPHWPPKVYYAKMCGSAVRNPQQLAEIGLTPWEGVPSEFPADARSDAVWTCDLPRERMEFRYTWVTNGITVLEVNNQMTCGDYW